MGTKGGGRKAVQKKLGRQDGRRGKQEAGHLSRQAKDTHAVLWGCMEPVSIVCLRATNVCKHIAAMAVSHCQCVVGCALTTVGISFLFLTPLFAVQC